MSSTESPTLNFWVKLGPCPGIGFRDRRRYQERDRGQEEQARLQSRADAIEFLCVKLQPTEKEAGAQHEQRVGDNRAGDGRFHQHVLPGAQSGERDDQLRQVSERGIEQPADGVARLGRD